MVTSPILSVIDRGNVMPYTHLTKTKEMNDARFVIAIEDTIALLTRQKHQRAEEYKKFVEEFFYNKAKEAAKQEQLNINQAVVEKSQPEKENATLIEKLINQLNEVLNQFYEAAHRILGSAKKAAVAATSTVLQKHGFGVQHAVAHQANATTAAIHQKLLSNPTALLTPVEKTQELTQSPQLHTKDAMRTQMKKSVHPSLHTHFENEIEKYDEPVVEKSRTQVIQIDQANSHQPVTKRIAFAFEVASIMHEMLERHPQYIAFHAAFFSMHVNHIDEVANDLLRTLTTTTAQLNTALGTPAFNIHRFFDPAAALRAPIPTFGAGRSILDEEELEKLKIRLGAPK